MKHKAEFAAIVLFFFILATASPAYGRDDDCACSSLSPPEGYYMTSISPVWVKGQAFLATGSMLTICESHLISLDVLLELAKILQQTKDPPLTVAQMLEGDYLIARLSLYPAKGSLAAKQLSVFVETSERKAILPTTILQWPAEGSAYLSLYVLVDKNDVLGPHPSWVRVHLAGPKGQAYFQVKG